MSNFQCVKLLWQHIISTLSILPQDIQTVLQDGSGGIWVHVRVNNGVVEIDRAKDNKPSSTLASPRHITENEFIELYPLYYQWKERKVTREQVTHQSQKSSYIFALIHKFDDISDKR